MDRREFIGSVAGALVAGSATANASAQKTRQPNIIYAFSDEHRWHSQSFTELPEVKTPNMAKLAQQGFEFTHCISNYPVCSPYRAMLQTGRWPFHTGIIDNNLPLRQDEWTIGKAFKQAGYRTALIGKWHMVGQHVEPFGYDHSLIWEGTNIHWDKSKYYPANGEPQQPKGYNATLMTDQALDFIRESKDNPFFLMISWNPPHSNFLDPPKEKLALYPEEKSLSKRPNYQASTEKKSDKEPVLGKNDWSVYQGYHAHISAIDDELGRLMAELEKLGLAEDTILIYTSDHGSMMGSHGLSGKRQPFEESIRVPFTIRWPGKIDAGKRNDALFGTIDIVPTLCALAGVPANAECAGQDFSPHCFGKTGPEPDVQFIMHIAKENASGGKEHPAPLFRGARTKTHTLAILQKGGGYLYDNSADPYQQHNLFDAPESEKLKGGLINKIKDWQKHAGENVWTIA
jgi:arylsulfatase A-like enzyme